MTDEPKPMPRGIAVAVGDFVRVHEPWERFRWGTVVEVVPFLRLDGTRSAKYLLRPDRGTIQRGQEDDWLVDERWCIRSDVSMRS